MPSSSTPTSSSTSRDYRYGTSVRHHSNSRSNSNSRSGRDAGWEGSSSSNRHRPPAPPVSSGRTTDRNMMDSDRDTYNQNQRQNQNHYSNHDFNHGNDNDDDAYARQVQEQYRHDFVLRQARRQDHARASAPPAEIIHVGADSDGFIPVMPPTHISTHTTSPFDEPDIEVMMYSPPSPSPRNPPQTHTHTHPTYDADDDLAYARQLQMEIEREERMLEEARQRNSRRSSSNGNGNGSAEYSRSFFRDANNTTTATATTTTSALPPASSNPQGRSNRNSNSNSNRSSRNNSRYEITPVSNEALPLRSSDRHNQAATIVATDEDADARLAQQLQDEELARQLAGASASGRVRTSRTRTTTTTTTAANAPRRSTAAATIVQVPPRVEYLERGQGPDRNKTRGSLRHASSNVPTSSTDSDTSSDIAARRLAQEMDDAEMAQRLALYEEEANRTRASQRQKNRTFRLVIGRILPLLCVGVAVAIALLFVLNVFDPKDVPFVGDWLNDKDDWIDPFKGNGTVFGGNGNNTPVVERSEQMAWSSDGQTGLRLELLDATEDRWQNILATAVANWDEGYPVDSLTLRITKVEYEAECTAVNGNIKVCNANYGATRWRGLNELMLNRRTNIIVSSVAKMNEYYLVNEGYDQQLYTMCHELGHGFGLPHWDENFFNDDLGNCMDYTNNPGDNKTPDESNFEFLRQIYGGTDVATGQLVSSAEAFSEGSSTSSTTGTTNPENQIDDDDDGVDDDEVTKDDKKGARRRFLGNGPNTSSRKTDPKNGLRSSSTSTLDDAQNQNQHLLQHSRVLLSTDDTVEGQQRRVLFANDYVEVHRITMTSSSSDELDYDTFEDVDGDYIKLQYYLLAPAT